MSESPKIFDLKFSPLIFTLLFAVLCGGIYFAKRSGANPQEYKNDFNVYYFAAQEIAAGRTPYENSLGEWTPYLYPPLLAELLVPLAFLPLPMAAYLWFLINATALIAALRMSVKLALGNEPKTAGASQDEKSGKNPLAPRRSQQIFACSMSLLILLRFVLDNFDYGQVNLLVTALAVAHLYFWRQDKKVLAAVALAFAVGLKITPVLLVIFHIAKLRLKYAIACLGLIAALIMLSFLPFGSRAGQAFDQFFNRTVNNGQGFNLAYSGNQSLQGAVHRMLGRSEVENPSLPESRAIAIGFLALAFIAAVVRKNELTASLPFYCLIVLLSPLSWKQHFVILLLPITFLVSQSMRKAAELIRNLSPATLCLIFAVFNLTSPKIIGTAAAEWSDEHSLVFAGALTLFIVLLLPPSAASQSDEMPG
jgi:hypothetical protein